MVENKNTSNLTQKINETCLKTSNYDPILDDPISSGEESSNGEDCQDSSSDEGIEIEFPRENG